MQKSNVEQIIRELARQNFNAYPESYEIENGLSTEEATTTAQEVAIGYWENRNESEIERDSELGITKIDYVDYVMAEYELYVQDILSDYSKIDTTSFRSVECKNLLDFQENSEFDQKWEDENGNVHYKIKSPISGEAESFYINDGEVIID